MGAPSHSPLLDQCGLHLYLSGMESHVSMFVLIDCGGVDLGKKLDALGSLRGLTASKK